MGTIGDGNIYDPLKAYLEAKTQGHKYVLFVDNKGNIGSRADRTFSLCNFFAAIADLFSGNNYNAKFVAEKLKERLVAPIEIPTDRSLKGQLSSNLTEAEAALGYFKTSLSKEENKGKYADAIPLLDTAIASVKDAQQSLDPSSSPKPAASSPPLSPQGSLDASRPTRANSAPVSQSGPSNKKAHNQPGSAPASLPGTRPPSPSEISDKEPRAQRSQSDSTRRPTTPPTPSKDQQVADKVRKQNESAARMGDALSNITHEETTRVTPASAVVTPETPPTEQEIEAFVKEYADVYIKKGHSDCSYRSHATVSHQANSNAPSIRCVAITFGKSNFQAPVTIPVPLTAVKKISSLSANERKGFIETTVSFGKNWKPFDEAYEKVLKKKRDQAS